MLIFWRRGKRYQKWNFVLLRIWSSYGTAGFGGWNLTQVKKFSQVLNVYYVLYFDVWSAANQTGIFICMFNQSCTMDSPLAPDCNLKRMLLVSAWMCREMLFYSHLFMCILVYRRTTRELGYGKQLHWYDI